MRYNLKFIKEYLQQDIISIIEKSKCFKWHKWFNDGETPYPCACPIREKYCIDLEFYYELQKMISLHNQEAYFKQAIEEFGLIDKQNSTAVKLWVNSYQEIGSNLFFNPTITILCDLENNDKLTIQLNPAEFNTVIQFQELFNTLYYSEEFQTNINP